MKNRLFGVLMVLIVSMLAVAPVSAQSVKLVADIPFEFVAGSTTFPAGEYSVEPMGSIGSHVVLVRSTDLRSSAALQTIAVWARDPQAKGKLVFNRYGDTYFLSQIWSPGYSTGRELSKSRLERRLAQSQPNPPKREIAVGGSR